MKLTKTTALKASLLLVLAANMSWEKIEFGSAQLAATGNPGSEQVKATGSGAAAPAAPPTSVSPPGASVVVSGPAPVPVILKTAESAQPPQKLTPMSHTSEEALLVCGDKYEVQFIEEEGRDGAKHTRVYATRRSNRADVLGIIEPRKILDVIGRQSAVLTRLDREIKTMRTDKKQSCPGETVTATADAKSDEDKKKHAEDEKNCKADKAGVALKSERVVACWTKAVAQVEKRIDKKDSDGKRVSEKERERALFAEISRISRILKADIKKGLLSKDESRVDEAREQLTAAMEGIIAGGTSLGGDDERGYENKISKIIGEFEALDKAAVTRQEALALKERGEDTKRNMRESYQGVLREPLSPQANADYQNAIREFNLLRYDIGRDFEQDELATLNRYKSSRLISNSDYNDFVKPYSDLQKLLKEAVATPSTVSATHSFSGKITGSVLGSDYEVAKDLATRRAELAANTARNLGTALPTARPTVQPTIGLQAPRSTFGN